MYLHEKLEEYGKNGCYPMHMPGHKRQLQEKPYDRDITEIEGFDNLHHSEGILKIDREKAAEFYGAGETRFLVNGSTCGVLAAISAVTEYGDSVIIGRNSHKSAYHAVQLRGLQAEYVYPDASLYEDWSIDGPIPPEAVRALLERSEQSEGLCEETVFQGRLQRKKAVFLTSPTYEGVISDIRKIADICHEHGVPLIVDEAHGAHLKVMGMEGDALEAGADIVILGLHKTMPVLTQGALLAVSREALREGRVSMKILDEYLGIYESSSPSYILMGSISRCVHWLDGSFEIEGRNRKKSAEACQKLLQETRRRLLSMKHFRLFPEGGRQGGDRDINFSINSCKTIYERGRDDDFERLICKQERDDCSDRLICEQGRNGGPGEPICEQKKNGFLYDPGKLVISTKGTGITGHELADRLREQYKIEIEMASADYVIAMTSMFDTEEGMRGFADAVLACDEMAEEIQNSACKKVQEEKQNQEREKMLKEKRRSVPDELKKEEQCQAWEKASKEGENSSRGKKSEQEKNPVCDEFPKAQIAMTIEEALSCARQHPEKVEKKDISFWLTRDKETIFAEKSDRKEAEITSQNPDRKEKETFPENKWEEKENRLSGRVEKKEISTEFIYVYPPGIPIITPGEIITKGVAKKIICDYNSGCALIGCEEREGKIMVSYITV